jgi:hypothetical protein
MKLVVPEFSAPGFLGFRPGKFRAVPVFGPQEKRGSQMVGEEIGWREGARISIRLKKEGGYNV